MSTILGDASLQATATIASRSINPIPAAGYSSALEAALNGGVLHYWPMFDVLNNQVIEDRVGTFNGTVINDTAGLSLVTNGKFGRARDFVAPGSNPTDAAMLTFPGDAVTTVDINEWTMAFWFYMHSGPDYADLPTIINVNDTGAAGGSGWNAYFDATDLLIFNFLLVSVANISMTAPSVGAWHLAVVQSSVDDGVEVFVDNISIGTDTDYQPLNLYEFDWYVGDWDETAASDLFFDGMVDELMVFDRVLTATERGNLYNSGTGIQLYLNANAHDEDISEGIGWTEAFASIAYDLLIAEVFGFGETAPTSQQTMTESIAEDIGLTEDTAPSRIVLATNAEVFGFGESTIANATLTDLISEGVGFGIGVELAGEVYTGWCMNAETGAVTSYQNYDFNSMTKFQGKYIGLSAGGLYELTGKNDAGTNIDAYIKLDKLDFGSEKMKRVPKIWLGYSADGAMALKTIDDAGVERWYELAETNGNLRERMVKMARRPESLYWSFEIRNKKGADFRIDRMNLLPIILTRRTNRRR